MAPTNIADDTCKVVLHSFQLVHRRLCDAVEQGVTVVQARAYAGCHSFGNIKGQTRTKMLQSSEVVVARSYNIVNTFSKVSAESPV